jgi:hypothetical protein
LKVERVVIGYDHTELIKIRQKIDLLKKIAMEVLSFEKVSYKPDEEIDPETMPERYKRTLKEIYELELQSIKEEKALINHERDFTSKGTVFVTFEKKDMA